MKKILLIILNVTLVKCQLKLFPDIQDLFQTFEEDPFNFTQLRRSGIFVKNISVDVEKLDMKKFKTKFNLTQYNETVQLKLNNETLPLNDTRRLDWIGSTWDFYYASRLQLKVKTIDLMLQIIYMARHKLQALENEKLFNPKDTSYRISFLYRRIRRIWKKMTDILNTMFYKRKKYSKPWNYLDPFLVLHHKAAKLHVDFLYLWWVQVKLHEKYCQFHGIPNIVRII